MSRTNFDQLLEAGCHFGHLRRKWNPAMAPYIFMERNGIHIIDLHKTVAKIDEAADALKQIAKSGKKILFVATKKQAKEIVAEKATSVNMPYVIERWPGGMLTNFPTIRKAVKKMANIDKLMNDGTYSKLSKRELLQITRQRAKLEKNLGSISDLIDVVLTACCNAIAEGLEERRAEKADEKAAAEQAEAAADAKPKRARKARKDAPAEEAAAQATEAPAAEEPAAE